MSDQHPTHITPEVERLLESYRRAGLRLFPCCRPDSAGPTGCNAAWHAQHRHGEGGRCPRPGKVPVAAWTRGGSSADPSAWRRWLAEGYNLACWTGPSGVVVVDLDVPEGLPVERVLAAARDTWPHPLGGWSSTCRVRTGCGLHVWFMAREWLRQAGDWTGWRGFDTILEVGGQPVRVEVRAGNSYVVVPPSVHESGRLYEWDRGFRPAALYSLPDGLEAALRESWEQRGQRRTAVRTGGVRPIPLDRLDALLGWLGADEALRTFLLRREVRPEFLHDLADEDSKGDLTGSGLEWRALRRLVALMERRGLSREKAERLLQVIGASARGFARQDGKPAGWWDGEVARTLEKPWPDGSVPFAGAERGGAGTAGGTAQGGTGGQTERVLQAAREIGAKPVLVHVRDFLHRAEDAEGVRWVVEGLVPEGLTLLVGDPKVGKSTLARQVAWCAARGFPFLGRTTRCWGRVVVCIGEEHPAEAAAHLKALGCPPEGVSGFHLVVDVPFGSWRAILDEAVGVGAAFILLDPGAWAVGVKRVIDPAHVYEVLRPVQQYALTHRIAVVTTLHEPKLRARDDVVAAPAGTMAFAGVADAVLVLRREKGAAQGDGRRVLEADGRRAGMFRGALPLAFEGGLYALREGEAALPPAARRALQELRHHPQGLTVTELSERCGRSRADVREALRLLLDSGLVYIVEVEGRRGFVYRAAGTPL